MTERINSLRAGPVGAGSRAPPARDLPRTAVQAAAGASREELDGVADAALRSRPPA
ncbi:hypothetical protein [Streptomyces sp. NPDC049916]|uniref:hypothetical protein n=1 Tax=Streptomyces sp. NPDC049916 TaxID=3155156 RepID=UPI00341C5E96